jgi:hypothetical protein
MSPPKSCWIISWDIPKDATEAAMSNIESRGLVVKFTSRCEFAIYVIYAVCKASTANFGQFARHLATEHLFKPQSGGSEYFGQWKAYVAQRVLKIDRTYINNSLPWSPLHESRMLSLTRGDICCPSCPFVASDFTWAWGLSEEQQCQLTAIREHHLSLLRPEAEVVNELMPYRWQVLRRHPEFVSHPVFADSNQPQQRKMDELLLEQKLSKDQISDSSRVPQSATSDFSAPI